MDEKIFEPSEEFSERLLKKVHEGLGLLRLVKDLKEEEEDDPLSFMDMIVSSERKKCSEEKKSKISFLDLI